MSGNSEEDKVHRVASGGLLLGVCLGAGNVLGYAFALLVSRGLGPDDFGAFSAVNNLGLLLTLPAGAFQVVIARHQANHEFRHTGLGMALAMGATLAALTIALSPLAVHVFDLNSAWPVLLLAAMLPGFTLTGAFQGMLLGRERFAALSLIYVVIAVSRVVAALVASAIGMDVTGMFGALLLASLVPVALGLFLCRDYLQLHHRRHGLDWPLLIELIRSNGTLAVLLALTSVDVLLARGFLSPDEAGAYAFAALFGRIVFWGTQFVALSIVPEIEHIHARRLVLQALGVVVGLGTVVTVGAALGPTWVIDHTGGADYELAADLVVPFALVGTLWACVQVLLFAEMARAGATLGLWSWIAVGAETVLLLVVRPTTGGGLLAIAAGTAAIIVVAGLMQLLRRPDRVDRPEPSEVLPSVIVI